jgi:1-acyl-sn-glycerol-3-phosphate acyltransferase
MTTFPYLAAPMLYYLLRPVARYVLRYYYRNIDLTGLENIPQNAAVILAANHPTAFIEPCILACFQPRTLWFLARGNLFKNRFYNALLAAVHILPVFRLEDGGFGRLKDNFGTFDACFRALSGGKAIMNLAEGRCIHEKALRPLRKGTARLALGAMQRDATLTEVYIVPVGCNFTHADRVRDQVMIRFGEPILTSEFMDEFRRSEATAIKNLTAHLRTRLNPLVVQFPDRERAGIGEARLELDRARHGRHHVYGTTHDGGQLDRELEIAAATPPEDPELTRLFNRLDRQGADVGAVAGAKQVEKQSWIWGKALLAGVLLLPHAPLWLLAEYIGGSRPKHVEFYSPVRFAVVAGGTLLVYPPALFLLAWPLKIWLILALLTVHWSLRQTENLRHWYRRRKLEQMVPAEREVINNQYSVLGVQAPEPLSTDR